MRGYLLTQDQGLQILHQERKIVVTRNVRIYCNLFFPAAGKPVTVSSTRRKRLRSFSVQLRFFCTRVSHFHETQQSSFQGFFAEKACIQIATCYGSPLSPCLLLLIVAFSLRSVTSVFLANSTRKVTEDNNKNKRTNLTAGTFPILSSAPRCATPSLPNP